MYRPLKVIKIWLRHSLFLNNVADCWNNSKKIFLKSGKGVQFKRFKCNTPPPPLMIPNFEGLRKTKQMVRLKCFYDDTIQNGGLKCSEI